MMNELQKGLGRPSRSALSIPEQNVALRNQLGHLTKALYQFTSKISNK